jgi:colanic acid biosynthesis glycosyl transferase WcaI
MKIAYVVQAFPPEIGAGPARAHELTRRWLETGSSVSILTAMPVRLPAADTAPAPAGADRVDRADRAERAAAARGGYRGIFAREDVDGRDVLRSWSYATRSSGVLPQVANNTSFMLTAAAHGLLRMPRPDVLIASSPPFFPHFTGRLLAARYRAPLVLEVRDLWPDYLVGFGMLRRGSAAARALFAAERSVLRAAAGVVVVTDTFADRIAAKGVDRRRIAVVPNGVDLGRYRPAPPPPDAVTAPDRSGAAPPAPLTFGYLGNFGRGQDLGVMVEVARLLRGEPVRIVLIGEGPERGRVEAAARAAGVTNLEIRDAVPRAATEACYHAFDVCLVPLAAVADFADTIPSKIFEIMACARPVLASVAGETQRLVENAGNGIAVPPADAPAIAAAIRRFAAMEPAQRHAMGLRGRDHVVRNYDRDVLADRYHAFLQDVVRQAGQQPTSNGR